MIKFDKNEFLKPQIYSTLDEYETRCNITEEIIKEIEQLQQENKILKENAENNDKVVDKVNWENQLLKKENKQLKEQLLVTQTNEETFRLEMKDITQTLGLDEYTIFDDVKAYARSLKDNWNKLKEFIVKEYYMYLPLEASTKSITILIDKMAELEQGNLIEK